MEMERDKREEPVQVTGLGENHGHNELHSEVDLADHHDTLGHSMDEEDHKPQDYNGYSKLQLVELIKELTKDTNFKKVDTLLREIKPVYDDIREKQKNEALLKFISSGGIAEDFDYRVDELDINFDANFKLIKERRHHYFKQQEDNKLDNFTRKEQLLEKLRVLSDSHDTNNQFDTFKELQKEWKGIGPVPGTQAKTQWANYHALVDRFYDNQSIYFELKELDRKKNLEAKLELCARAEKLATVEIIRDAIRELNELHHEFKHLGPVPMENKESLWQRFKAASDAVYSKRDQYLQKLQSELKINLDQKIKLAEEAESVVSFQSDRIKEWNQKTKEVLEIQKKWEVIGGVPRAKAKEINKKFWTAFKAFFISKNAFFKKLDEERERNLQLKKELVLKALALKESQDWEKASYELKSLQLKWKEVGPVSEKFREKIFIEFKEACDFFFEQRRHQHDKAENEQTENLKVKEAICAELEKHALDHTASEPIWRALQEKFSAVGFVPKKDITQVRNRYHEAVEKFIQSIPDLNADEKNQIVLENQLRDLRNDPMGEEKIFQKEQTIRKRISKVENDISLWKNNLEFFGRSQNAERYKEEFNDKIKTASDHLKELRQQLKLLKTV